MRCTAVEPSSASATMDEEKKFPGLVTLGRTRENEGKGANGFGCRRRFRHFHDARARSGLALGASRGPGRERYHLSPRSVATAALQQVLQRVVQRVVQLVVQQVVVYWDEPGGDPDTTRPAVHG